MDALLVERIPEGPEWHYEPKWDGFRCIVFRDGKNLFLQSRKGQPFGRYFPELVALFQGLPAGKFVLDGEIVIPSATGTALDFDMLLQRIHPAESRVQKLSRSHPAAFIAFDLLGNDKGKALLNLPLCERRAELVRFMKAHAPRHERLFLSPATARLKDAEQWLTQVGAALDGVVAKRLDLPYQSGERTGMVKVKRMRTADCVVGGFRYGQKTRVVGSLLLGLYDEHGDLHHVGFTSTIPVAQRAALTRKMEALIKPPGFTGSQPGGPSRWSAGRETEWHPLAPKLVVEVRYDHYSGGRFRHGTKLLRWRADKGPEQCTLKQVAQEATVPIFEELAAK